VHPDERERLKHDLSSMPRRTEQEEELYRRTEMNLERLEQQLRLAAANNKAGPTDRMLAVLPCCVSLKLLDASSTSELMSIRGSPGPGAHSQEENVLVRIQGRHLNMCLLHAG
jgi:hypothetical protein